MDKHAGWPPPPPPPPSPSPPPSVLVEQDVSFQASDGTGLAARYWSREAPRGIVLIAHGLGEHGGCYRNLAEVLLKQLDLDVLAFDFRGHGRSSGRRGVVRHYDDLMLDVDAALNWVRQRNPGLPVFLLGHSNGGLVALRFVLVGGHDLSGLILSNPALKLRAVVPFWKRLMGAILLRVAPGITLDTSIPDDELTADPIALAAIAADPLRHTRISPPLYFGMLDAGLATLSQAGEVRLPTLVLIGGDDRLIDPGVNQAFFDRLAATDKTPKVYPEMKHEPLQEQGREVVVGDIVGWLGDRSMTVDAQG